MAAGGNKRFGAIGKRGGRVTHFHLKADPLRSPRGLTHLTSVMTLRCSPNPQRASRPETRSGRHTLAWGLAAERIGSALARNPMRPTAPRPRKASRYRWWNADSRIEGPQETGSSGKRTHPFGLDQCREPSGVERSNLLQASLEAAGRHEPRPGALDHAGRQPALGCEPAGFFWPSLPSNPGAQDQQKSLRGSMARGMGSVKQEQNSGGCGSSAGSQMVSIVLTSKPVSYFFGMALTNI